MGVVMNKLISIDNIIEYWKNIEFLGQAEIPAEKPEDRVNNKKAKNQMKNKNGTKLLVKKICLFHEIKDGVNVENFLMQDGQEYSAYHVLGDNLYYCFGNIKREKCTALIANQVHYESELRPEKQSDSIAWFAFKTTTDGAYVRGSLSVSPVLWAIDVMKKQGIKELDRAISYQNYRTFIKEFENQFFNKEKLSVSDINKIYKAFYDKYINQYFKNESYEMNGKLIYQRYCSIEEKQKEAYETDYSCLWRSFIFKDLELFQEKFREGCFGNTEYEDMVLNYIYALYSDGIEKKKRIDISSQAEKKELKDFFQKNLDIGRAPLGKWPSRYMPALMQQAAVNLFTSDDNCKVFSVNGPPGTGKTTMLKEIVANNIVERAKLLAECEDADDLFERCSFEYGDIAGSKGYDKYAPYYYRLKNDKINEYGILVASCNNAAVENITMELPDGKGIIGSLKSEEDDCEEVSAGLIKIRELFSVESKEEIKEDSEEDIYFTQYARHMIDSIDAWGMISAPLGKLKNVDKYCRIVLEPFLKNNIIEKRNVHKEKYLKAREKFQEQLAIVEKLRDEVELFCNYETAISNMPTPEEYDLKIAQCNKKLEEMSQAYESVLAQYKCLDNEKIELQKEVSEKQEAIIDLEDSRTWNDRIKKLFGKKTMRDLKIEQGKDEYVRKVEKLKKLQADIERKNAEKVRSADELDRFKTDVNRIMEQKQKIEAEKEYYEQCLQRFSVKDNKIIPLNEEFLHKYLSEDNLQSTEAQVTNPWFSHKYNREREKLFYDACVLNKEFVLSSKCCMHNVKNLLVAWGWSTETATSMDWRDREKAFATLLQTVFLITPVISTTFASVQSFLKDIKSPEVLGTLVIDEAGQASPQMALGAMFRCRKCIVVGDPKQIEPVVTDEVDLLKDVIVPEDLRAYKNKSNSVQVFADSINLYGTYLGKDTEKIWIGCPLNVHRRCISPMYDISNEISYNNTMKQKTLPPNPEKEKNFCYKQSCWIDVKGLEKDTEAKNHFVEKQGEIVLKILEKAFSVSDSPNLFIISPFKSVVKEMITEIQESDLIRKYGGMKNKVLEWIEDTDKKRVGTVHTFQGKEADEVIVLLGCDKNSKGAVRWVNSNIVNVAATRAKYRVYFIGDKDVWASSKVVDRARKIIGCEINPASEDIELQKNEHHCPLCNGKLVLRYNHKSGSEFYGCSNFPECRYTTSEM